MDDETRPPEIFFEIQHAALAELPRHQTPATYFRWAREALPPAFPDVFIAEDSDKNERLAYWIARGLWSNAPLPANKFRPKPLPDPKRNGPCPCGSGRKFKACCIRFPIATSPPQLELWPAFARTQPEEYWLQVATQLPTAGVSAVGEWLHEQGRWKPLAELLAPRFAAGQRITTEHAGLLHSLCEAYEHLPASSAKLDALLARLVDSPNRIVRSTANLRLATTLQTRNDSEGAWSAWRRAAKATPDNATVALVELGMLTDNKQYERARRRAGFWLSRLADDPQLSEEALDTIRRFETDPRRALDAEDDDYQLLPEHVESALDGLLEWTRELQGRPLPDLEWQTLDDADEALRDARLLVADAAAIALEGEWRERSGAEKPHSIDMLSGQEGEVLDKIVDWLPWLQEHPQALDCISILDDLTRLLISVEGIVKPARTCVDDLAERGFAILTKHWPDDRAGTMPWALEANRPALRLLSLGIENETWSGRKASMLRFYLRLNPNDNHGLRTELVNQLLIDADDAEAATIASRYPKDMFAEVAYGRALALHRLKQVADAEAALATALDHLPKVADYLLAEDIAEPASGPHGMVIGGDHQAWLYRQAMRGEWQKTAGALDWLATRRRDGPLRQRPRFRDGALGWLTARRKAIQERRKGRR